MEYTIITATKIVHRGSWEQIDIVAQYWKDGKNEYEEILMTIGRYFWNEEDAERFMSEKFFKTIFNTVKKNAEKILKFKSKP